MTPSWNNSSHMLGSCCILQHTSCCILPHTSCCFLQHQILALLTRQPSSHSKKHIGASCSFSRQASATVTRLHNKHTDSDGPRHISHARTHTQAHTYTLISTQHIGAHTHTHSPTHCYFTLYASALLCLYTHTQCPVLNCTNPTLTCFCLHRMQKWLTTFGCPAQATCSPWLWCLQSGSVVARLHCHNSPVLQLQVSLGVQCFYVLCASVPVCAIIWCVAVDQVIDSENGFTFGSATTPSTLVLSFVLMWVKWGWWGTQINHDCSFVWCRKSRRVLWSKWSVIVHCSRYN